MDVRSEAAVRIGDASMKDLPEGFTEADWRSSATVRDISRLDEALAELQRLPVDQRPKRLLDLGCGMGALSAYLRDTFDLEHVAGVDLDEERLAQARERGIETHRLDLNEDRFPFPDTSFGLVTSFGAFEHFLWYDNTVSETARVLADGGHFLLSMPNLGSYVNRFALLLGYQPRDVEISQETFAGALPRYKNDPSQHPLWHVHSATLRAMKELLDHFELDTVGTWPFSPDHGSRAARIADKVFGHFPSISRRFILLARRRAR